MAKKISHFQLGLFFLICLVIVVGGLIWAGTTHVFTSTKTYVTFFNESVQGLNPGARVTYLGVQVGTVQAIGIAPDGKLIRVEMQLASNFDVANMAVKLIFAGIMGQLYLSIDQAPPDLDQITPKINFPLKYPLIPAHPSEIQIAEALAKIYKKIDAVDFEGLIADWMKTAQEATRLLADKDIRKTIQNFREISADIKNLVNILGEPGTPQKWKKSFADLAAAAAAAQKSSEALASQLERISPGSVGNIARQMEQTIFQINQVLTNLKGLVHELQEKPGKIFIIPREEEPFRR
jgi:phospholipid/cholesterol/gamma-HCH transport system substrate-binding protein